MPRPGLGPTSLAVFRLVTGRLINNKLEPFENLNCDISGIALDDCHSLGMEPI